MGPPFRPPDSVNVARPVPVKVGDVGDVITYATAVQDHRIITHRRIEVVAHDVARPMGAANYTHTPGSSWSRQVLVSASSLQQGNRHPGAAV